MKVEKFIPKTFEIAGQSYKVKVAKDIDCDGAVGQARFFENEVRVRTHYNGKPVTPDVMNQTMYHELVHVILHTMNEDELNSNESFVDQFGHLLYQYLKSAKF